MKKLAQYINESLMPIFELSDDLLKRAIEKCYSQNTTLNRRRAKEFENYLKDPDRIKREELNKKSPVIQKIAKAYDDHLIRGYKLFDDKKKDQALQEIELFVREIKKIIFDNCNTSKIKVSTGGVGYAHKTYVSSSDIGFTRKRNGTLFDDRGIGFEIDLQLKDDNEKKLQAYDYRRDITGIMTFQFYKKDDREKHNQGTYSVYFDFPWYCIPPEYKDDFESIYKVICEVLAQNFDESYFKRYIGKNSLNEELPTWELINNSFYANMDDCPIKEVIEKICEVLKEKDKNCSVRFGEFSKKNSESNYWIGRMNVLDTDITLKAVLTYKGKEYNIAGTSHSGGFSASSKIYIDGQLAFGASKEKYDEGCWIGGKYKCYDALKEIFPD